MMAGSIIVANSRAKTKFRPGQRRRAKLNATRQEENVTPMTAKKQTIMVLAK
ncbi:MAG: hypothetical protein IPK16_10260 [Anaerolineales bacterium]|nr:hypothetical protein [Anaerolineales bacterium]